MLLFEQLLYNASHCSGSGKLGNLHVGLQNRDALEAYNSTIDTRHYVLHQSNSQQHLSCRFQAVAQVRLPATCVPYMDLTC